MFALARLSCLYVIIALLLILVYCFILSVKLVENLSITVFRELLATAAGLNLMTQDQILVLWIRTVGT